MLRPPLPNKEREYLSMKFWGGGGGVRKKEKIKKNGTKEKGNEKNINFGRNEQFKG